MRFVLAVIFSVLVLPVVFFVIALVLPAVSGKAVSAAMDAVYKETGALPAAGTLIVVDFTMPSFRKRLAVIDFESGEKNFQLVAHGRNSGLLFAEVFSDIPDSKTSSLGLYSVDEEYAGIHGKSLRLSGLSNGLNRNARMRGIVIHQADYVSFNAMLLNAADGFRIGRSEGCFALGSQGLDSLLANLRRPAFLFVYSGDK